MKNILFFIMTVPFMLSGQEETLDLPYVEIPEHKVELTAGTALARVVDGLGYRYYWATDSLRVEDLEYRISEDSRTSGETLDHLLGLSYTIVNATKGIPNERPVDWGEMTFVQKRAQSLQNFHDAATALRNASDEEVAGMEMIFKRGERTSSYPIWNLLNGPIDDAIYHVGQIVSYRRASGNPMHPGVSVFTGKTRL